MLASSEVDSALVLDLGSRKRFPYVDLRNGDKAIRRQGAVDWVKMGEQSMVEGMFFFFISTFRILVTNLIIGKATSLSLCERAQIYLSVSRKSETSVSDLATLALIARSTTGVLSGLGRIKGRSIWAIAQDLASGIHPKPSALRIKTRSLFSRF